MSSSLPHKIVGALLVVAGVAALIAVPFNLSNRMDADDLAGTSGDLFALGIVPLGMLGVITTVGGLMLLRVRQKQTAATS